MVLRIGGLASGMDIDSLVEQLMTAEKVPLDKLNQNKTFTEWQRDDYREMNTLLLSLDNLLSEGITKQSTFIKKSINSSNEAALSIKNVNSTVDFSGSIKIDKLATAASMKSDGKTLITDYDSKKTLREYGINDSKLTISAIDANGVLNSKEIDITDTDTMDSLISKINQQSGVTAFYDSQTNQFSLTAKNTGEIEGAEITLSTSTGGTLLDKLNIDSSNTDTEKGINTAGSNAEIVYNGITTTRTSNVFKINGVELTLKQVTSDTVNFSSTPDVDSIYDSIKSFVDKYNEIIGKISDKIGETKYRDYAPLTDAQKEAMTEDEIKKWEEKAKSGTLKNDQILSNVLNRMRSSLGSIVSGNGTYSRLSDIGIATTNNYLEGGKLEIDEDKLKAAITADPNSVYKLFQNSGAQSSSEYGLAQKVRENLKTAMNEIKTKAGSSSSVNNTFTLGKLLNQYSTRIDDFEDKLTTIENRYWSRFTAMETAINKANSQSAYLTNMFSSQ
ncbi:MULTISPECIES: flagellar hook-associated protein 2 [Bacillaceae]|uniref:flagellar hook-associated protein 2 n=1 Tax=Bacillaceae TaxID=186817 RepID=UPI001F1B2444|nr:MULTISPECIES: flagellar hook-associated protein 2 [Bacillaceae]MCF2649505.1 flagellar hook-associated protein 2 [Niallia circulans]CAI9385713.1 Flagellar hook-associated protein 2 [Bacillus sp. T2.9-1]